MRKPKVLIVEEDPRISGLLQFTLELVGGFDVCGLTPDQIYPDTLRKLPPDAVILSSEGKGSVLQDLKAMGVPMVYVAGSREEAEQGTARGEWVLSEPFAPHTVISTVRRAVMKAKRPKTRRARKTRTSEAEFPVRRILSSPASTAGSKGSIRSSVTSWR